MFTQSATIEMKIQNDHKRNKQSKNTKWIKLSIIHSYSCYLRKIHTRKKSLRIRPRFFFLFTLPCTIWKQKKNITVSCRYFNLPKRYKNIIASMYFILFIKKKKKKNFQQRDNIVHNKIFLWKEMQTKEEKKMENGKKSENISQRFSFVLLNMAKLK